MAILAGCPGVDSTPWTTYSPTVTAGAGTPTTTSATGRYKQIGKTVIAQMDVVITDIGTASGALIVSLPVTAATFRFVGNSFEYQSTGKSGGTLLNGPSTPTTCSSRDAATGTYWVNGYRVAVTVTYEAA